MAEILSDQAAIKFQQDNPKRRGSQAHDRYEKYKSAVTPKEALGLGAVKGDVPNDIKKGFCSVDGAAASTQAAVAAPKPKLVASPSKPAASPQRGSPPVAAVPEAVLSPKRSVEEAAGEGADEILPPAKRQALEVPVAELPQLVQPAVIAQHQAATLPEPAQPLQPEIAQLSAPAAPQPGQPVESGTSSSSGASAPKYEVDLSFAKLDGKPIKFMRRVMGEARRLLSERGLQENLKEGLDFSLKDRDNLAKYAVTVRDLNPDGQLYKDFVRLGIEPGIDLELSLPDGFPLEPPFARVVYPELTGGFVFRGGGICFEPLTAKGWAPSMTLASLCIAIKGILDFGDVRTSGAGNKETRTVPHYTEVAARKDHTMISNAHRGGDARTYQSNIKS